MGNFFIVGAQRSGSTLLRLILNSHSLIAIPEEARFIEPLLRRKYLARGISGDELGTVADYLSSNPHFQLWNYDPGGFISGLRREGEITARDIIDRMYKSYCESEGKAIWGDKSLFFRNIDVLHSMFRDARFIHIVRDGRDVFDSWRRMDGARDNVPAAALDWTYKLGRIERSFGRLPRGTAMTVRYEDLLERPEDTLASICSFLGVGFERGMLEFYKTSRYYIGKHHSELIFRPINSSNAYKWKKTLTPREARVFTVMAGRRLRKYGYDTEGARLLPSDAPFFMKGLLAGLPRRLLSVLRTRIIYKTAFAGGRATWDLPIGEMPANKEKTGGQKGH